MFPNEDLVKDVIVRSSEIAGAKDKCEDILGAISKVFAFGFLGISENKAKSKLWLEYCISVGNTGLDKLCAYTKQRNTELYCLIGLIYIYGAGVQADKSVGLYWISEAYRECPIPKSNFESIYREICKGQDEKVTDLLWEEILKNLMLVRPVR